MIADPRAEIIPSTAGRESRTERGSCARTHSNCAVNTSDTRHARKLDDRPFLLSLCCRSLTAFASFTSHLTHQVEQEAE